MTEYSRSVSNIDHMNAELMYMLATLLTHQAALLK